VRSKQGYSKTKTASENSIILRFNRHNYEQDKEYKYDGNDKHYHKTMLIQGSQSDNNQYVITSGDYGIFVYRAEAEDIIYKI